MRGITAGLHASEGSTQAKSMNTRAVGQISWNIFFHREPAGEKEEVLIILKHGWFAGCGPN
jgi:hypothetical protein